MLLHKLCATLTRHRWGKRLPVEWDGKQIYICRVCGQVVRRE